MSEVIPTLFRLRWEERGGHTHVRFFAGKGTLSLGLCGHLVFRNEEWGDFKEALLFMGNVELVEEGEAGRHSSD